MTAETAEEDVSEDLQGDVGQRGSPVVFTELPVPFIFAEVDDCHIAGATSPGIASVIPRNLRFDRQHEALYLWILHKLGFAGEVFAKFTNGISYEYTPGFVPSYDFLLEPKNYKLVAKKMAHLHTLPIRETVRRFLSDDEFVVDEEPCVLKHIHRYIELLPSDDFPQKNSMTVQKAKNDNEQKRTYPPEYPSRTDLLQEARFLEKLLKGAKSPVAFCHNDLLLGNMVISPSQDSVSFIDFEYCGYNHTAYDIADHFAEFAGNRDIDFSRYPSEAMQRDWLRIYLSTLKGITSSSSLSLEQGDSSLILQSVTDEEIDDWMQEVRLFTMASHLLWGIWSMVQSFRSNIDYDFKAYALAKIGRSKFSRICIPRTPAHSSSASPSYHYFQSIYPSDVKRLLHARCRLLLTGFQHLNPLAPFVPCSFLSLVLPLCVMLFTYFPFC
ncbi:Ethanolamine kinase [Sparganum proliferum]